MTTASARVALITGSGRNIGREIALEMARERVNVVVNAKANRSEAAVILKEAQTLSVKTFAWLAISHVKLCM